MKLFSKKNKILEEEVNNLDEVASSADLMNYWGVDIIKRADEENIKLGIYKKF
jgi:hypothetical protein